MNEAFDNCLVRKTRLDQDATISNIHAPRVLVVGNDQVAARVECALGNAGLKGSVETVEGYLTAVGHIGSTGAPDVLIGYANGSTDDLPATLATLRRVAPQTRMWVMGNGTEIPGADRCLDVTINDDEMKRLLIEATGSIEGIPAPGPPESDRTRNASRATAPKTDPLGDIELLETILDVRSNTDELRATAVRLIAERSGIDSVNWAQTSQDVPSANASAAIQHRDLYLGDLHAPAPARVGDLQPWAAWLARWLALDQRMNSLWQMALRDDLTGAWNRRYFNRFLKMIVDRAISERFCVTVLVFDIDDFKSYNDSFGHAAGDEILVETSRLIQSVVRDRDVVARIGGDEFAVIFWDAEERRTPDSKHPSDVRDATRRFRDAIRNSHFPKLASEAHGTLTISGGLASFPWDGRTPKELLARADEMAMQSKRHGKNAITFGPGALREESRK